LLHGGYGHSSVGDTRSLDPEARDLANNSRDQSTIIHGVDHSEGGGNHGVNICVLEVSKYEWGSRI